MPTLEVRRLKPAPAELQSFETAVIRQRQEYAAWDLPSYEHIYLGIIEGDVDDLLNVLEKEVDSYRLKHPSAKFTLEYHPSCIPHSEYPFQIYSFTLIKDSDASKVKQRQLMIMSWKVPHQENYDEENIMIDSFMAYHKITPYDDGSQVRCRIQRVPTHADEHVSDKLAS